MASKDGLPVSFTKVKDPASGMDFLSLKPAYKTVVNHGSAIGGGFRGVDQKSGQDDTIYDDVSAQEDINTTQTAFTGAVKKLADTDVAEAASWKAGQHYPCDPAEPAGISA